jgi:hypothetical protein
MKVRASPEWQEIYRENHKILKSAYIDFSKKKKNAIRLFYEKTKQDKFIISRRNDEILRACSDDLYRYANYHQVIKSDARHLEIQESIRASYLVKWIMNFRPLILDSLKNWIKEDDAVSTLPEEDRKKTLDFLRKSNEVFAVFVASRCLAIPTGAVDSDGNPEIHMLTNFLTDDNELEDFMYTLRYRINHQDIFRALFRRLDAPDGSSGVLSIPLK